MIGLTQCMESCVSCFYFTYCRFNELKSPIRIRGIFQRAYTKPGLQRPTKYRARAAVVSTIIKRLYFPLSHVCKLGGVILNYYYYYYTIYNNNYYINSRPNLQTPRGLARSNSPFPFPFQRLPRRLMHCLNK